MTYLPPEVAPPDAGQDKTKGRPDIVKASLTAACKALDRELGVGEARVER